MATHPTSSDPARTPGEFGHRVRSNRVQLRVRLAEELKTRIRAGDWSVGGQLPTESELADRYHVSRSTVRAALQDLENQGLTVTRHGIGTFVTPFATGITSGLQELSSITTTLAAHGLEPGMGYRSRLVRVPNDDEQAALGLGADDEVLHTERAILANGVTVAFSYDSIPIRLLPPGFDTDSVRGSLFAVLESTGLVPKTAVAEVHAARGAEIGWGDVPDDALYVLLKQTHYTDSTDPILRSLTYFIEGRFQFSVLRTR